MRFPFWNSRSLVLWALALCGVFPWQSSFAGEFRLAPSSPTLDRWVYPFGDFLGDRPVSPTFASFDPRFDTRDAQTLLGWDTADLLPIQSGPRRYLIRKARLAVTVAANNAFVYDPTFDTYLTYATNHPAYTPDADPGRPVELYGAGFRNGFTAESFQEKSSFGKLNPITSDTISIGTRNAFAAMFGTNGTLVDIANNVGQANVQWTQPPFEVQPWAVGVTTNAQPGEMVPADAVFTFEIDLTNPWIVGYLQSALDTGRIRLFLSSLSPASQVTPGGIGGGGAGAYPQWSTRENLLYDPPRLEMEGTLVGAEDADADGLPDDWENFYFGSLKVQPGDDTDGDGANTMDEYLAGTDPASASSVLRLSVVSTDSDGNTVFLFGIAPSRAYRIEISYDLNQWGPAQGTLSYSQAGSAMFVEQKSALRPAPPRQAFYRIVVE